MKAGDYATACPAIERSFDLEPLPGTLFSWAECEHRAAHPAAAYRLFDRFLELVRALPPEQARLQEARVNAARGREQELEPLVAKLELDKPATLSPNVNVELDGHELGPTDLERPLILEPGAHHLEVRSPDATTEKSLSLQAGQLERVTLEEPVPPSPAAPVPAPLVVAPVVATTPAPPAAAERDDGSAARTWGWVALGAGAVGFVATGVATAVLLEKKPTLEASCPDAHCTSADAYATAESVPAWNVVGTAGFVLGLAGVGVGGYLLLTSPSPSHPQVGLRPRSGAWSGLQLEGTF